MVNRAAVLLKCKPPIVKWINETDPSDRDSEIAIEDERYSLWYLPCIDRRHPLAMTPLRVSQGACIIGIKNLVRTASAKVERLQSKSETSDFGSRGPEV
jgi:hypothetical protein